MSLPFFKHSEATADEIEQLLVLCDEDFHPSLSSRVDISAYARKISGNAECFELWRNETLVGLVAMYCHISGTSGFITNVCIHPEQRGKGFSSYLIDKCISDMRARGGSEIELDVGASNIAARALYERCGFFIINECVLTGELRMKLSLNEGEMMLKRDYDSEIMDTHDHQYSYDFDFDVIHPYMIDSFRPFFRQGNLLELGSFKGDFTRRLLDLFDDITCVEASGLAIEEARTKISDKVNYVNDVFEDVILPCQYDNIVLTHVLEHLDDPVRVLKRINDEWLVEGGRFFLVCPNANAPSRQIAVKMGLITHNAAVTPAEREHGHRVTYSLDTLERDARAAGLKVIHRSGIFFKALANFQWDRLLQTNIISKEYLNGCYELGKIYPDLCSSIFLLCERGGKA